MLIFLKTLLASLASIFRSRASLGLENLALRHQIGVLHRSAGKRPKLTAGDTSRSEEHTSELQSRLHLVCRLLLEKKKETNSTSQYLALLLSAEHTVDH